MPTTIHQIPITAIAEDALVRDRTHMDPEALEELTGSIREDGLRLPIEVFVLDDPKDGRTHGLISGFRRLAAVRALAAEEVAGFETVAAFVRAPADMAAALVAMVEENEIREGISAWERGSVLVQVVRMELFADVDAAITALHPRASRMQRTRLRAYARAADELSYVFEAPELFNRDEVMRLAAACRAGFGDAIRAAVDAVDHEYWHERDWKRQREAALGVLAEAAGADESAAQATGRVLVLSPKLKVRMARVKGGWSFRFTGGNAHWAHLEPAISNIEVMFGIE